MSDNIFSQYVYKSLPATNQLILFKKQLCLQTALTGILSHMLLAGGRTPNKTLISRDTGRIFQMELAPVYGEKGAIERTEYVRGRQRETVGEGEGEGGRQHIGRDVFDM